MKKYVIVTDSCSDLAKDLREKYEIDYLQMHLLYDDKDVPADVDWGTIGFKPFYQMMRDGVRFKTSQVNASEYETAFEKYIADGFDILSISCSGMLSSSYKCSLAARDEVLKKHPDAKIFCVDSCNSCGGLNVICTTASLMRKEGKTIEEVANYLEAHKNEVNQLCTVDSLTYLKRAGRVSVMSSVFGGLLQIKPILISDVKGRNVANEKVKGRKNSLMRLGDLFAEGYNKNAEYQRVIIMHADCEDDVEFLKNYITEKTELAHPVEIGRIGPIIGASAGPGTIAIYFYGKEVTFDGGKE